MEKHSISNSSRGRTIATIIGTLCFIVSGCSSESSNPDGLVSPVVNTDNVIEDMAVVNSSMPSFFAAAKAADEKGTTSLNQYESRARFAKILLKNEDGTISIPDKFVLELFKGESYVVEITNRELTVDGMSVWSGRTQSSPLSHQDNYSDVTIVVDPKTGVLGVTLALVDASYSIRFVEGDTYEVSKLSDLRLENDAVALVEKRESSQKLSTRAKVVGGEQDAKGVHVVDVLVGFSTGAAAELRGKINLAANQMIAEANNGLRNSNVDNVRLRLVRVAQSPDNEGITTATLKNGLKWFADDIEKYAPDIVSLVQTATANDAGGGVAWLSGFENANLTKPLVQIFRHEVGHNAGVLHCEHQKGNSIPYGYGWAVPGRGDLRTHMCGNTINYYSNPDVTVDGHRVGDAQTANAARVWRERAAILSGHRKHTIPFDVTEPAPVSNQGNLIKNLAGNTCLDAFGGARSPGSKLGLWHCDNANANQQWKVESNGLIRLADKTTLCVGIDANSDLKLRQCNVGDSNQIWRAGPSLSVRSDTGKCMDPKGGGIAGKYAQALNCSGNQYQRWEVMGLADGGIIQPPPPVEPPPSVSQQRKLIRNLTGNTCLDVFDGARSPGAKLGLWHCDNANTNQQWNLKPNGLIRLSDMATLCVGMDAYSDLELQQCNVGNANQIWRASTNSALRTDSGKCMDPKGGGVVGKYAQALDCSGNHYQRWVVQ